MSKRKQYDYTFRVLKAEHADRVLGGGPNLKRILRKLVREAVHREMLNACSGNRFSKDDIAKELIP